MRWLLALLFAAPLLAQDPDRPYLAMDLRELDAKEAAKLGLDVKEGLAVVRTRIGGPARQAGILPLDLLLAVDGSLVKTRDAYRSVMAFHHIGDEVTLSLSREGKPLEVKVKLLSKKAYDDEWVLKGHPMPDLAVDSWIGEEPKDLRGAVVLIEFWQAG